MKKIILLNCFLGLVSNAMAVSFPDSSMQNKYEPANGVVWKNSIDEDNTIFFTDQNTQRYLDIYQVDNKYYLAGIMGRAYEINVCGGVKDIEYREGYQYIKNKTLAVVSIDGLNVLSGQPANFNQGGYVVDKKPARMQNNCVVIKGWRKGINEVAQFNFTNINRSYNARTRNNTSNIGIIGFAFFDEMPLRTYIERPSVFGRGTREESGNFQNSIPAPSSSAIESLDSNKNTDSSGGGSMKRSQSAEKIGTGHGQILKSESREVNFLREKEYPNKIVTIEYKTYEELEQMGIINRRERREETPNAFPGRNNRGFAQDPKY